MFGKFDYNNQEFIITDPKTPTPWMNYLSNNEYCVLISNTGGGFSFHIDPRNRRITRYRYNNIPYDRPGKYIYIKDKETSKIWSPTWQPVQSSLENYECHIGLGYNTIHSTFESIDSTVSYFVPAEENVEIWHLNLKNKSFNRKSLTLFTYVEFALWDAINDQWDLQYRQNIAICKFETNTIYSSLFDFSTNMFSFFTCSEKIESFDCDRESFIGLYRSESNPLAVENGVCSNSIAVGGNPIASTSLTVNLEPNESKDIIFILGVVKSKEDAFKIQKKYNKTKLVQTEKEKNKKSWIEKISSLEIKSPEEAVDNLVNVFNAYQCHMTFNWSRYVSYYETGTGRGMGFRDCCQDILGVCHVIPKRVRKRIIELIENQFKDGHVYHQFFPLTKTGGFPDYVKPEMLFFSDDHLWIILSVTYYIKETGDFGLLKEQVKYVDSGPESVYDHLKKSIEFSLNHFGNHSIPLMGSADWNDALQLPGKESESVWSGMLLHKVLLEMVALCQQINNIEDASFFHNKAEQLNKIINTTCWDDEWYIRAFTAKGDPVGSKKSGEGIFYLNTQSWAIYSQVASPERGSLILQKVKERLATEYGVKLFDAPYTKFYPELGGISTFPPGLKENASIFCHTNPWLVIAECMNGNGDQAFEYYSNYSPLSKIKIQDIHRTEPYIFSQMITGPDHMKFGQAKNSWLTGTAAWSFHAMTNWILGVQPEYKGLLVDPCIPRKWKEFSIKRVFRSSTYHISINNPKNVSRGVIKVIADDIEIRTNVLPIFNDSKDHFVKITMG